MESKMKEMTDTLTKGVLTNQAVNFMMNWLGDLARENTKIKENIKDLTTRIKQLEENKK